MTINNRRRAEHFNEIDMPRLDIFTDMGYKTHASATTASKDLHIYSGTRKRTAIDCI